MNLHQLEYFQSSAVFQNFSRAAQYHFVSESTLSRQIAALEKELRTPLFVREARGVTLTKAGIILFRKSVELLQQVGEFRRCLVDEKLAPEEDKSPFFRIANSITDSIFSDLLDRMDRIPSGTLTTQCKIDIVRAGAVPNAVLKGSDDVGIDLACNLRQYGDAFCTSHFLFSPLRVLVGPGHKLHGRDSIGVDEFISRYRTWSRFLLPEVMGYMVAERTIGTVDDILQLRQIIARHLPYIESERWALDPDDRMLLPPNHGAMPGSIAALHTVVIEGVDPSATDFVFFWKRENSGSPNLIGFIEAMTRMKP